MDQTSTQTVATFSGMLVRRKRAPGKPFVQLVFREAGQDWLCLTSNLQHAARLQMGKTYRIEGLFKSLGEHSYIHEPNIAPLAREIVKRRWWIALGIGLAILLTAGGIVLAATYENRPKPATTPLPVVQEPAASNTSDNSDSTNAPATSDTTTTPPPATTTPAATTPKNTTTQPPNNPPANNNQNPAPPPPAPTAPVAPSDVAATSSADGTSVTLSWTAASGADSYQIYRDGSLLGASPNAGYTDTPTTPGTAYSYYVVAVNTADNLLSGTSNTANVTTNNPGP